MGSDVFEVIVNITKAVIIFIMMVQLVPLLVWVERRGSAFIQSRFGPNRVGPLGLMQLLADAVKFLGKEEFAPGKSRRLIFYMAPVVALIPGALAFACIPLSLPINIEVFTTDFFGLLSPQEYGPYRFAFQSFEIGIGIVFVLGISSLGAYSILMAGWSSENKFSLLGALRASAQMISYELALGLSLVGILLLYNTFSFAPMIEQQMGPMTFSWFGQEQIIEALPNWGIFYQPLGFVLLFVALFAEANRTPFDLPEAEAELVAGYHTEYGGLKMLMFYIGEYGHMLVASALIVVFYFGGYDIGNWFGWQLSSEVVFNYLVNQEAILGLTMSANKASVLTALFFHVVFLTKVLFFLWIFIWVRWTIPRFRYDQLMNLGWKTMLPWALGNTIVTAVVIFIMRSTAGGQ